MSTTLEAVAQELALFQLNTLKRLDEIEKKIKSLEELVKRCAYLEERVKTLEDARSRQILLNATFVTKGPAEVKPRTFWDWWKSD